jgi:uncharacterized protein (TIGR02266 family)
MIGDVVTRDHYTDDEAPTAKWDGGAGRSETINATRKTSVRVCARAPRIAVCLLVSFEIDSCFYVGLTENLSEEGVFIATRAVRDVGSRIDLGIVLPEQEPLRARGTVVWQRPPARGKLPLSGMGIRFDDLPAHEKSRIRELAEMRDATPITVDWEIDPIA